jgi:hypothetical protein
MPLASGRSQDRNWPLGKGSMLTVGGARSALPAERLIFTAALARSTADSSPAIYSASSIRL